MREVWLKPNVRALRLGLILPVLVALTGAAIVALVTTGRLPAALNVLGIVLSVIGSLGTLGIMRELRRPRLAYENGDVLAYVRAGSPVRIPVEIVEGFLIGQAPSLLPGRYRERYETTTFILRLSESAAEWSHGEVKPALGRWCDGYITIRGTWCEPLSVDLARRLNQRLADIQAARAKPQSV
jgi:hypothetical protein